MTDGACLMGAENSRYNPADYAFRQKASSADCLAQAAVRPAIAHRCYGIQVCIILGDL